MGIEVTAGFRGRVGVDLELYPCQRERAREGGREGGGRERERAHVHSSCHIGLIGRTSSLQNVQTLCDKADNRHKIILP